MPQDYAKLETEKVNPYTRQIDQCSTLEMVRLINDQDAHVAAAVRAEDAHIAAAVDLIVESFQKGGRLIYFGAGTSGRLGVVDASECVPTFGVSPDLVQGFIAGGDGALRVPVENAEDDPNEGVRVLEQVKANEKDVVCGISASGGAPCVLGFLREGKRRGAATIGLCTNPGAPLAEICDVTIAPNVGPEVLSGSTRMKSGTAQKMVLNMLTTCAMIRLGKAYGNLMVDLVATNQKLRSRALRLTKEATGADEEICKACLEKAGGHVKTAILMVLTGLDASDAREALSRTSGHLRQAIATVQEGKHAIDG